MRKVLLIPVFFVLSLLVLRSQSEVPLTRILFLFDASQSMLGQWSSGNKMDVAVKLLCDMVDSLKKAPNAEIALRLYGHQSHVPPQDCGDTKLMVGFGRNNHDRIKGVLKDLRPRGTTPIAYSLEQAAKDFPAGGGVRNIIILITDGKEECNGDPCAISKAMQEKGVVLKPFIIGVGLNADIKTEFECVGNYYDAYNEQSFREVLNVVITQALYPTTVQVNLLDSYGKPTETNVPFTLFDAKTGAVKYNFVHTLNHKDDPDTLRLDNLTTYRLKVHTIPPVELNDIKITPGRHNVIAVDAPQGSMQLSIKGRNEYVVLKCIVRKDGEMQTLHVQDFGQTEKYITGKYDLEILTNPRMYINDVKITQSTTTTVEIEQAGLVNVAMGGAGYGAIFKMNGKIPEFVCNINPGALNQSFVLQPGDYKAVFRYKAVKETLFSKDRNFTVKSGESVMVDLRN